MRAHAGLVFRCGFENAGVCGMTQTLINEGVTREGLLWIRHSGATDSTLTGPSSAQSGQYYIYVEATGQQEGDIAG